MLDWRVVRVPSLIIELNNLLSDRLLEVDVISNLSASDILDFADNYPKWVAVSDNEVHFKFGEQHESYAETMKEYFRSGSPNDIVTRLDCVLQGVF